MEKIQESKESHLAIKLNDPDGKLVLETVSHRREIRTMPLPLEATSGKKRGASPIIFADEGQLPIEHITRCYQEDKDGQKAPRWLIFSRDGSVRFGGRDEANQAQEEGAETVTVTALATSIRDHRSKALFEVFEEGLPRGSFSQYFVKVVSPTSTSRGLVLRFSEETIDRALDLFFPGESREEVSSTEEDKAGVKKAAQKVAARLQAIRAIREKAAYTEPDKIMSALKEEFGRTPFFSEINMLLIELEAPLREEIRRLKSLLAKGRINEARIRDLEHNLQLERRRVLDVERMAKSMASQQRKEDWNNLVSDKGPRILYLGEKLGRYYVCEAIGGGSNSVFLLDRVATGSNESTPRFLVLKAALVGSRYEKIAERNRGEYDLLSQLADSPVSECFPRAYSFIAGNFTIGANTYREGIVMEYCPYINILFPPMERKSEIPDGDFVLLLSQAVQVIKYLSSLGRDIPGDCYKDGFLWDHKRKQLKIIDWNVSGYDRKAFSELKDGGKISRETRNKIEKEQMRQLGFLLARVFAYRMSMGLGKAQTEGRYLDALNEMLETYPDRGLAEVVQKMCAFGEKGDYQTLEELERDLSDLVKSKPDG